MLTEYVRNALKRYISHKFTRGGNTLVVYLLDPQIEETVRAAIQHTQSGSYLALEPEITQEMLTATRNEVGNLPPTGSESGDPHDDGDQALLSKAGRTGVPTSRGTLLPGALTGYEHPTYRKN